MLPVPAEAGKNTKNAAVASRDTRFPRDDGAAFEKHLGQNMLIGIISDTHGVLKQNALAALRGVDHIVHAGDIGSPDVLDALKQIAPVTAVRGNTDRAPWARSLPADTILALDGKTFYVLHDLQALDLDPGAAGIQVVVSGHTHHPLIKMDNGIVYVNPGSASQRRRGGSLSIGRVRVSAGELQPEIIRLES